MQNRLKHRISRNLQLCSETSTGTGTRNSTLKIWPVLKHPLHSPWVRYWPYVSELYHIPQLFLYWYVVK